MLPEEVLPGKADHRSKELMVEFSELVMKRRTVRRFEDGGVEREVIERIARFAQRTPAAGFSQGQRLLVVTEPERRPRRLPRLRRGSAIVLVRLARRIDPSPS